jgi:hypothetical protein
MEADNQNMAKLVLKIYIRVLLYVSNDLNNNKINTFLVYLNDLVKENKAREEDDDDFKSIDQIYIESIANKNLLKYKKKCKKSSEEEEGTGTGDEDGKDEDEDGKDGKDGPGAVAKDGAAGDGPGDGPGDGKDGAAEAVAKAAEAEAKAAEAVAVAKAAEVAEVAEAGDGAAGDGAAGAEAMAKAAGYGKDGPGGADGAEQISQNSAKMRDAIQFVDGADEDLKKYINTLVEYAIKEHEYKATNVDGVLSMYPGWPPPPANLSADSDKLAREYAQIFAKEKVAKRKNTPVLKTPLAPIAPFVPRPKQQEPLSVEPEKAAPEVAEVAKAEADKVEANKVEAGPGVVAAPDAAPKIGEARRKELQDQINSIDSISGEKTAKEKTILEKQKKHLQWLL